MHMYTAPLPASLLTVLQLNATQVVRQISFPRSLDLLHMDYHYSHPSN